MNTGDRYSKTFNIPISHLDYSYITNCNNLQELEKIYFTLHVGEEGHFPDLENHCEKKLKELNPNSRVLKKAEELKINLTKEFENFIIEAQKTDSELLDTNNNNINNSSNNNNNPICGKSISKKKKRNKKKKNKSPVPNNCSKIAANLDKEILEDEPEEMNEKEKQRMKEEASKTQAENTKMLLKGVSSKIDTTGMTNSEKDTLAISEKEKGNESFKSGDYIESITYYTRSLSVMPTSTVYNNRGFAFMKQNKWKEALCDLNEAIKLEPNNVKALYRRAKCNYEIDDLISCFVDCQNYLKLDPDCKLTQKLLDDAEAKLQMKSQPTLKNGNKIARTAVDPEDKSETQKQELDQSKILLGDVIEREQREKDSKTHCEIEIDDFLKKIESIKNEEDELFIKEESVYMKLRKFTTKISLTRESNSWCGVLYFVLMNFKLENGKYDDEVNLDEEFYVEAGVIYKDGERWWGRREFIVKGNLEESMTGYVVARTFSDYKNEILKNNVLKIQVKLNETCEARCFQVSNFNL